MSTIEAKPVPEAAARAKARLDFVIDGVLDDLGTLMMEQVEERFRTQGASGGAAWPPKVFGGGPALAGMLKTFDYQVEGTRVTLFSRHPFAYVHQLGTVGKGGTLPTVVPKKAKALWIPLTEKARAEGPSPILSRDRRGGFVRGRMVRMKATEMVLGRVASKFKFRKTELVKGVDFIFARKVDIPPRPMLPKSVTEIDAQRRLITEGLKAMGDD